MLKVVYVAGYSRSGSTAVGLAIAARMGALFVGETIHVPSRSDTRTRCTCGEWDIDCRVWKHYLRDAPSVSASFRRLERGRVMGLIGALRKQSAARRHVEAVERSVVEGAKSNVIVDTSKRPMYGALLALLNHDVFFVWLRRRRRDVVEAQETSKPYRTGDRAMGGRSRLRSSVAWLYQNIQCWFLSHVMRRTARLRFEDVMRERGVTITDDLIAELQAFGPTSMQGMSHALHGNPRTLDSVPVSREGG